MVLLNILTVSPTLNFHHTHTQSTVKDPLLLMCRFSDSLGDRNERGNYLGSHAFKKTPENKDDSKSLTTKQKLWKQTCSVVCVLGGQPMHSSWLIRSTHVTRLGSLVLIVMQLHFSLVPSTYLLPLAGIRQDQRKMVWKQQKPGSKNQVLKALFPQAT